MEMNSNTECLNFIDFIILNDIEKHISVGTLENIRNFMLENYNDKYIEDMISMSAIFSQINLIIDKLYSDTECDNKKLYYDLRKRILDWLDENNSKLEVDDQE